ncbi:MAG: tRNA 2-thiouridine(34) synthase MnmA [Myxococcota bacterium]|nr:tRNA 2-thiouridine(34) synthase MnmA [Myxococcota bacterium]
MRVVVAMSGGVDSSVAAGMMVEAGHEVLGLTMKLRDTTPEERSGRTASCCSPDDLMDARAVCDTLGVPHYIVDYRELFREKVMGPFAESYLQGRTPNPCVACNDHVKFAPLIQRAKALGAELLVTGHYARILPEDGGLYSLRTGADLTKDQSYFLFGLDQAILSQTQFPLGTMDKGAVRDFARKMGLPNWDKADSEDICFVPNGDYRPVVEKIAGSDRLPGSGDILDETGRKVGEHGGVHQFTVGQRKGLRLASTERLFVLSVDASENTVHVGRRSALEARGLVAQDCRWISGEAPTPGVKLRTKIRYRHDGVAAEVVAESERALVRFDEPQTAISPGQAAVFYDGDRVVGGGWIDRAIAEDGAAEAVVYGG